MRVTVTWTSSVVTMQKESVRSAPGTEWAVTKFSVPMCMCPTGQSVMVTINEKGQQRGCRSSPHRQVRQCGPGRGVVQCDQRLGWKRKWDQGLWIKAMPRSWPYLVGSGRFTSNGMIKCMLKTKTKTTVDDFRREKKWRQFSPQQKKRQNKVRTGELKKKTTEKQWRLVWIFRKQFVQ